MLGKNPLPISLFTYYSLKIKFVPFQKKLASHNSMEKKDDKVGNKTAYKRERQRRKIEREKKIKIDVHKKRFIYQAKFCLMRTHENQKRYLILSRSCGLFTSRGVNKPTTGQNTTRTTLQTLKAMQEKNLPMPAGYTGH